MNSLDELIELVAGIWVVIFLVATAPLWLIPYIIYERVKNRKMSERAKGEDS